eukprot:113462_1
MCIITSEILCFTILLIMVLKTGLFHRVNNTNAQQFYMNVLCFIAKSTEYTLYNLSSKQITQKQDEIIRICCVNKVLYDGMGHRYGKDQDFYKYLTTHSVVNQERMYPYSDVKLEHIKQFNVLTNDENITQKLSKYLKFKFSYIFDNMLLPNCMEKILLYVLCPLYLIGRVMYILFPIFAMLFLLSMYNHNHIPILKTCMCIISLVYLTCTISCIYLFFDIYILSKVTHQQLLSFILPSRKYLTINTDIKLVYEYYNMIIIHRIVKHIITSQFCNDIAYTIMQYLDYKNEENINENGKILLLGPGGVGKSTFMKQLDLLTSRNVYLDMYTWSINYQIIDDMQWVLKNLPTNAVTDPTLLNYINHDMHWGYDYKIRNKCRSCEHMHLELSNDAEQAAIRIASVNWNDNELTVSIVNDIKCLWNEEIIRVIFESRSITALADTTPYFWNDIDRISQANYIPTHKDWLYENHRTTGIIQCKYSIDNIVYNVYDTGGQRCERRKWIHIYENVANVIFIASLNHYDKVLFEDYNSNAMDDAIELWDFICNNVWFTGSELILLLNKTDLFKEKIKKIPITVCHSLAGFNGDFTDYEQTVTYIKNVFENCNRSNRKIYILITCVVDINDFKYIFQDIQNIVVNKSMQCNKLL